MILSMCIACGLLLAQESNTPKSTPPSPIEAITPTMIQADVDHLADDSYYGRYWLSPFARRAAEWIKTQFEDAGLEPMLPDDAWFQELKTKDASPNVVGILRGTDPGAGYVLIGAHYDHLPPKRRGKDKIYNGADDNASGTAAVIAIARALVPLRAELRSSVVFIAFTGEEAGFKGSRHFTTEPPLPLKSIRGLFNLDMISRGEEDLICIDGAKQSPDLIRVIRKANEEVGLRLQVDTHPDWLPRSDQWPFLSKGVQAVLFSVEDHEDYHEVTDHSDRIIASLAARVAQLVALATMELAAEAPDPPKAVPSAPLEEPVKDPAP